VGGGTLSQTTRGANDRVIGPSSGQADEMLLCRHASLLLLYSACMLNQGFFACEAPAVIRVLFAPGSKLVKPCAFTRKSYGYERIEMSAGICCSQYNRSFPASADCHGRASASGTQMTCTGKRRSMHALYRPTAHHE
jgi:hypothetical protein